MAALADVLATKSLNMPLTLYRSIFQPDVTICGWKSRFQQSGANITECYFLRSFSHNKSQSSTAISATLKVFTLVVAVAYYAAYIIIGIIWLGRLTKFADNLCDCIINHLHLSNTWLFRYHNYIVFFSEIGKLSQQWWVACKWSKYMKEIVKVQAKLEWNQFKKFLS